MQEQLLQQKVRKKELELNALLEITQAINGNLPEASLYKIFNFTLRANLNITKLALYVFDESWSCKVHFGTAADFASVPLDESLKSLKDHHFPNGEMEGDFAEFDLVIPVVHKSSTLAVVCIGGLENFGTLHERDETVKFVKALSNIIVVAVENKKLAKRQLAQEAFRKELEIASDVQQFLFPDKLPATERLKIEASYLPHDHVGGDYYDYIPINKNQFLICVGDVSGKGIPAALLMSNFQASLRTLLRQTPNLTEVVEALNYQINQSTKGEKFITFFAAIYDISFKTMVYINAGHNPPILIRRNDIEELKEGSTVLGAMDPLPFISEGFVTDLDEFTLFCYTDGITETQNEAGEEFGFDRLLDYWRKSKHKPLKTIHEDIIVALDTFKGKMGYHDDITMLTCQAGF